MSNSRRLFPILGVAVTANAVIGGSGVLYLKILTMSMCEFYTEAGAFDFPYAAGIFLLAGLYFLPILLSIEVLLLSVGWLVVRGLRSAFKRD